MNKLRVLLTGSTGLLGKMIEQSINESVDLFTIGRETRFDLAGANQYFKIDLLNSVEFNKITNKILPDVIVHCAAVIPSEVNPDSIDLAKINSQIDNSVFQAVSSIGCRMIYMSSTIVYGYPSNVFNLNESSPLKIISNYAAQKNDSEKYILHNFKNALILRINAPYGIHMRTENVMTKFIRNAMINAPISLYGKGKRMQDFTNSRDIADLIYQLLISKKWQTGVFNVTSGNPISMRHLAEIIVKLTSSQSIILMTDIIDDQENYKASYSTTKAKKKLNWYAKTSLELGIKEMLNNNFKN